MKNGIFITGTDTGVGKTVIAAGFAGALRLRGIDAGVMKPVQSGGKMAGSRLVSEDGRFLLKVSGVEDEDYLVNPCCLKFPLAPNVASRLEGVKIDLAQIINAYRELSRRHKFVIVEGIGGLLVPLRDDYLVADLIEELRLPLLIVARPGLGTINHTLLTIKCARERGIEITGVVINHNRREKSELCEQTNSQVIAEIGRVPILGTVPYIDSVDIKRVQAGDLVEVVGRCIDIDRIVGPRHFRCGSENKDDTGEKERNYRELSLADKNYIWHPFTQMQDYLKEEPLIIEEARGCRLKDVRGRWYLDGVSSLWVNVHGHRKTEIDQAITVQLSKVAHSTLLGLANVPSIRLAQRLTEITPAGLSKVFYSDSGSTAVEIALKIAFQYCRQNSKDSKKKKFVYFENSYHGDTIGSVGVGGISLFHTMYKPLLFDAIKVNSPYCYRCGFNLSHPQCNLACLAELEEVLKQNSSQIAALIIEPLVQGAAGILVSPSGFLAAVRRLCSDYGIIMIADCVAVGFGRTGMMFACEHEKVSPDIMTLAKSISAGYLPLAATLATEEIYRGFCGKYKENRTFFHGHTYTGNPLACAAALANLELFDKEETLRKLVPKVELLQREIEQWEELEHVGQVRQKGMIVGVELVADKNTKQPYQREQKMGIRVIQEARKRGLILRPLGDVIVLMPPLAISLAELKEILDITRESIRVATAGVPQAGA